MRRQLMYSRDFPRFLWLPRFQEYLMDDRFLRVLEQSFQLMYMGHLRVRVDGFLDRLVPRLQFLRDL